MTWRADVAMLKPDTDDPDEKKNLLYINIFLYRYVGMFFFALHFLVKIGGGLFSSLPFSTLGSIEWNSV